MSSGAEITPNQPLMRLAHLKARKGEPPWFERVVLTDDQLATVICQAPGTPNERHFHSMCDEWWAILEGEITWDIEGRGVVHARQGDVVFVPRNTFHLISVVGKTPAIRLAVATPDVFHELEKPGAAGRETPPPNPLPASREGAKEEIPPAGGEGDKALPPDSRDGPGSGRQS